MQNERPNRRVIRFVFYALWLSVSLLQAYNTELIGDEAYYWKYAQDLSWGYFDHPPMVAVFIKAGYALFNNELGVRLLFILAGMLLTFFLENLTAPKNLLWFYLSVASVAALHFLGLLALPDMPLLLFTGTFLWLYKRYLQQNSLLYTLLLAINVALLFYSKYHAVLVVGFTVLANPAILKRGSFWAITIISITLFTPHILWQFDNGLPSINYHLQEPSGTPYSIEFTLNYLLSVILIFAPSVGLAMAWLTGKTKTTDTFDKTLKYIFFGTLLFFLAMSFKGRVEGNWIGIALIPAIILGYKSLEQKKWAGKFIKTSFTVTILLVLIVRTYMMYDLAPDIQALEYARNKIHNTKAWAEVIESVAGETPIVFMNRYQHAAQYEFYTGHKAISLNNRMGRKNQYNIWNDEMQLQGKDVMLVPNFEMNFGQKAETPKGTIEYHLIYNFRSSSEICITTDIQDTTINEGGFDIDFKISTDKPIDVEANEHYPTMLRALFFKDGKLIKDVYTEMRITNEMLQSDSKHTVHIESPEKGEYQMYLDVATGLLPPSINSKAVNITVQ